MKRKILLYVLLFVSITLRGNVYFKHLGKTDGLSQISVISICQDELGRMWFGTLEGLSCYDGNSMTVYKPSQDSVRSFLGNNVDNLVSDKQGNLFFISDYALVRYDLRKEQFSLLKQRANCLHVHNQEVWAATRDSVFKWDRQKEEFAFIYQLSVKKYITYLYVDDNECVWLGTTDGLYRVDNLDNPAPVCVIPKVNVLSLYRDTKGKMWVAAFRQGMYTIENGISQQFVDEQNFLLSNNDIRCFVEDDEGSIWIGTFNGLNKIDTLGNVSCYVAKQYVMTNAFKSVENSGADWDNLTLTPKEMSISGTPTEVATYTKTGSILAMADALLKDGAVRGNVTVDGTYLVKGKKDLKVEVPAFAVNFMSPFNDAVLNFYKGGKVVDLNVAIASDGTGTIAKVDGAAGKEAGLQLVASSEKVAVSNAMELFGVKNTDDKFTFVVKGEGVPAGAKAKLSDGGIALTGMTYAPNYLATLEMTVTALNGIKTTITLPMTINKP